MASPVLVPRGLPPVRLAASSTASRTSEPWEPAPAARATLQFSPGSTLVVPDAQGDTFSLNLSGAAITVSSGSVAANRLMLTVTFQPDPGAPYNDLLVVRAGGPTGWTPQPAGIGHTVTYLYGAPLADGESARIGYGRFFGTSAWSQRGSFRLAFTAPGAAETSYLVPLRA